MATVPGIDFSLRPIKMSASGQAWKSFFARPFADFETQLTWCRMYLSLARRRSPPTSTSTIPAA